MLMDANATIFSAQNLLWMAGSAIAAVLLLGLVTRRRDRLTDSLRDYVEQAQKPEDASADKRPDDPSDD